MVIVYFDGVCNLCNAFVDFLVRHDPQRRLRYAPLQGQTAAAKLPASFRQNLSTFVLQDGDQIFTESTAALRILSQLGGIYRLSGLFLALPRFLRDPFYRLVARWRYTLAGKRSTCRLPTPEERALFLD